MSGDAWPPFHPDLEHPPASHPGAIDGCPPCRPAIAEPLDCSDQLAQAVRQCIAAAWDQVAYVFDWLAPGMGDGLRAMLLDVQDTLGNWVCATVIYGTAGAATELDYYTDARRVQTWQHCRKGLITGTIIGETADGVWVTIRVQGDHRLTYYSEAYRGYTHMDGATVTVRREYLTEVAR